MKLKHFALAALAVSSFALQSCDEDDSQVIDIEPNDEQLLVSSNTSGQITKIQTGDLSEPDTKMINVDFEDADGIAIRGDDAYILDRSNGRLKYLRDAFDDDNEDMVDVGATSDVSIVNGRGIAVGRETFSSNVAVAQDASSDNNNQNKIFLFRTQGDEINLTAEVDVPFNVWGVEWLNDDLLAVVDNSDSIAVFEDFDDIATGTASPTYYVKINGITRTHGIAYGSDDDILILTDVGDAGSDSDGAFLFIRNWEDTLEDAKANNVINASDHSMVSGAATLLGNPVDVAYDDDNNHIFIAERARDGGRVLAFDVPDATTSSPAPIFNIAVPGAASLAYRD